MRTSDYINVGVAMPPEMKAALERLGTEWGICERQGPGRPGIVPEVIRRLCRIEIERRSHPPLAPK